LEGFDDGAQHANNPLDRLFALASASADDLAASTRCLDFRTGCATETVSTDYEFLREIAVPKDFNQTLTRSVGESSTPDGCHFNASSVLELI
jgi:hypothetical protein